MKTKYCVYENKKPAKYPDYKVHTSWKNNEFDTKFESVEHTHKWLGVYSPSIEVLNVFFDKNDCFLYNYSGYGDIVEVRKEERE